MYHLKIYFIIGFMVFLSCIAYTIIKESNQNKRLRKHKYGDVIIMLASDKKPTNFQIFLQAAVYGLIYPVIAIAGIITILMSVLRN